MSASRIFSGIAGSPGVATARAVVLAPDKVRYRRRRISEQRCRDEMARFDAAVQSVQHDLRRKVSAVGHDTPHASILDAYELMVGDETLAAAVRELICTQLRCADWAVVAATESIASKLDGAADPYIRERRHDIEFVGELLLRVLTSSHDELQLSGDGPSIVVARDLSPADTAAMVHGQVVGFVTEVGSRTSHTAIMARALEIPAVVGARGVLGGIAGGELLIIDGLRGTVTVNPSAEQVNEAERRAANYMSMTQTLGRKRDEPAITQDGRPIELLANIELPREAPVAVEHGAQGVGLYRTEFLYINRAVAPTEEEQLTMFRTVIAGMAGRHITLRTFDIGGDKFASTFRMPQQLNPMLGLRALRLALAEPEMFLTHLRAMLRASAEGDVKIMLPMVSTISEWEQAMAFVEQAKQQLQQRGQPYRHDVPVGVMIEVPAAAVMADQFAARCDFLSIGSNDLVQYALAVDRSSEALATLASPFEPGILRLVVGVIEAAKRANTPLSLCGEMGSEPLGALLLVGLGMRTLSMESVAIPEVKEAIVRVKLTELEPLAQQALLCATGAEVERLLIDALGARLHDLLTGQRDANPRSSRRGWGGPSSR